MAVRTDNLIEQFNWLRENGYQPVSIAQILAARQGGPGAAAQSHVVDV